MKNPINIRVGKKAIATALTQVLVGLFAVGITGFLHFLLIGRYFDVHAIIESNEAQRHAINIVQVFVSSEKLVYEEDVGGMKRFHRGVLDKEKLDAHLIKQGGFDNERFAEKGKELIEEIRYPNTGTRIVVSDIDAKRNWVLSFGGPGLENSKQVVGCLYDKLRRIDTLKEFFETVLNFRKTGTPWSDWDAEECHRTYGSKIGMFNQEFPVLINDNGAIHAGRIYVSVMEL